MKELDLNSDIPHIPAELLSQAVTKLETFRAIGDVLTAAQISAVFTRLSVMGEHKLKTLDLSRSTELTTEQLTGIYRMVADRRCSRLRKINLSGNDLSSVSQDIQDRARLNESVQITVW